MRRKGGLKMSNVKSSYERVKTTLSDILYREKGYVTVVSEKIDELDESGTFLFQIRLHSDIDENGRFVDSVSLPPFSAEIKRRIDM